MVFVYLMLQWFGQPDWAELAQSLRNQYSWQMVRTDRLEPQWTVSLARPEARRPTITLVQISPPAQPTVDPRSYSLATNLPAGPVIVPPVMRDEMGENFPIMKPAAAMAPVDSFPATSTAAEQSLTVGPTPLMGDLRAFLSRTLLPPLPPPTDGGEDPGFPHIAGPSGPAGPGGGPGGGIGAPIPEPSGISILLIAGSLILRRKRREQDSIN